MKLISYTQQEGTIRGGILAGAQRITYSSNTVDLGRTPQRWLKPGEEMVIDITGLGTLRNRTRSA